jgi:hypothetical protein
MNTDEIQQIVRDLGQAKEAAQSFAEGSVGQFRQVQSAMSNLAQVTGDQLGSIRDCWDEAGQEVGENAVPLLQEAVDALLGDLGRIGNLEEILPGGEKLSGVVNGLTTALGGLSGFLAENGDLIGKIGLSEEHTQKIAQVASTVLKVRSHLAEVGGAASEAVKSVKGFSNMLGTAAEAVPPLKNVLGATGKTIQGIGAVGATAFVGWEVGKLIGEVTGLNHKLVELAENRALKNQKSDRELYRDAWVAKYGGVDQKDNRGQTFEQFYAALQEKDRQKAERKRQAAQKPPPEPAQPEPATMPAEGEERAEAESEAAEEVAEAREEALQEQEEHDETVIKSHEAFADRASRTIEREGHLLAQAEANAAEEARQARLKAEQDQKNDHERQVAQLKQQRWRVAAVAKQAGTRAQAARAALLQTGSRKEERKARKEAEKKAKEKERAEARLDRQIAGARRREAELKRAGYTTEEARKQMTKRGRELLRADDLRRKADWTESAAKRLRDEEEKKVESNDPPPKGTSGTGTPAGGGPGTGTPAGDSTGSGTPAGGGPGTGALGVSNTRTDTLLPNTPGLSAPPACGAEILGELKEHTRLLNQIAQSEGVR